MPEMTLAEAAKWAGVGKPALLKAMHRSGNNRLSAHKDDKGQWHIDPAELARVYPREPDGTTAGNGHRSALELVKDARVNGQEIALLRELADREKERADELAQERDHWRKQAEEAQADMRKAIEKIDRLLTYQAPSPPAAQQPEPRRGMLSWFASWDHKPRRAG